MADRMDVRRIALGLPEVEEADDHFGFSARGRGGKLKGFAWTWNERLEPKRPRVPNNDVLAVRVANAQDKETLLASDPAKFFTEPHYNGFPAVLVRLPAIQADELAELITDAWLAVVPARLGRELRSRGRGAG